MKKEIQKIVRDYVKENPVPKIKEDSLKNPNNLSMLELRNTDEGKEMIKDIIAFRDWNDPLGKEIEKYRQEKKMGKEDRKKAFHFGSDEIDKLLGFKVKRFYD